MSIISTSTARRSRTSDGIGGTASIAATRATQAVPAALSPQGGLVRPFLRRWMTAGLLLAAAVLATLYIANAIAVDNLLVDITSLERERDVALSENEKLRAELLRLMSVERVTTLAGERLGLVLPARPPQDLTSGAAGAAQVQPRNGGVSDAPAGNASAEAPADGGAPR